MYTSILTEEMRQKYYKDNSKCPVCNNRVLQKKGDYSSLTLGGETIITRTVWCSNCKIEFMEEYHLHSITEIIEVDGQTY